MTPYFFLACYVIGITLTIFRHHIFGVYTYLFTFYMSPSHSWWGDLVPDIRYLFIIGVITLVMSFRDKASDDRPTWLSFTASKIILALVVWMWIQYFWALDQNKHLDGTTEYTKHVIIYYLIYKTFDTQERIIDFLLFHSIGCAWFGYLALGAGGGRLETIGGPVGGSNELGMHVSTAMIAGGLMWMFLKGWKKHTIFFAMPLIANTIVLTVSRGAFLGFFFGGMIAGLSIPKQLRSKFFGLSILAMALISLLAHDQLIERFADSLEAFSSDEKEFDSSASKRVDIFNAGIQMGLDYPLGAGHRGTNVLSPYYMDESILAENSGQRSAHNTFAAVFADHGFVGAALYVSLILWLTKSLFRVKNCNRTIMDTTDKIIAVGLASAVIGMWISGNFSNSLFTETQYWLIALFCSQLARTIDNPLNKQPSNRKR